MLVEDLMEALGEAMYENFTFLLSCLGAGGAGGGPDGDPGRGHVRKLYLFIVLFRSWRSW